MTTDRAASPSTTPARAAIASGTTPLDSTRLSPVDIAVNLLWCVPGDVGGSEQYLVRQLLGLAALPPEFLPTLFCLPSFVDAHPDLAALYPMETASISGMRRSRRVLSESTWLHRRTRDAEVVHHGGGTVPTLSNRPIVLTIHDLQHLTHPEYLTATKRRYLDWTIPRSVRNASVVAVPTDYVRSTVIDAYGTDPDRVIVVPHGVDASLGLGAPSEFDLRRDYGLGSGRVIVFPAITHPHKNHRFLLEMMATRWTDPDLRLVLLGGRGLVDSEVNDQIARLGLSHRVVRPGRVSDAHRDGLIAMADALVFPSEYEGFGAPVVEAMALGTPVIASDQPALAEVIGDAGIVVPLELDAWTDTLDDAIGRADELRTAGRRRASYYSTVRSGTALARAYRLAQRTNR